MKILAEVNSLIKALRPWFYSLLLLAAVVFSAPVFSGLPRRQAGRSLSQLAISRIQADLLDPDIHAVVTAPAEAFVAQATVALIIAVFLTLPLLLAGVIRFVSPGLKKSEKTALGKIILPSLVLASGGAVFGYLVITPATLKVLYLFARGQEITTFITLGSLISFTAGSVFVSAAVFLIPILMVLLTRFGLVSARRWRRGWRFAVAGFLIFTAVITPDGSGVTMLLLAGPLTGLYLLGTFLTGRSL